jgi:acyl-CoA reductase-like NAD-dependent aldehyde dehydrogenase
MSSSNGRKNQSEIEVESESPMRLPIEKTYKMFVKGAFIRSEGGHTLPFVDAQTGAITNIARGTRKDARDAVIAAKAGHHTWSSQTPYLRGQILYRLAEVMEGRRSELIESRRGAGAKEAEKEVDSTIDRVLHYAGWSDKIVSVLSTVNPVSGPHFNVSSPEPMGVVVVAAPEGEQALLALVSAILPIVVGGNAALASAPECDPKTSIVWCECVATSDMPAGVINVLTGLRRETLPHLASHMDVQGLDLWTSATVDAAFAQSLAQAGAANVKRVKVRDGARIDWSSDDAQGLGFIEGWLETKTVWHPVGL